MLLSVFLLLFVVFGNDIRRNYHPLNGGDSNVTEYVDYRADGPVDCIGHIIF